MVVFRIGPSHRTRTGRGQGSEWEQNIQVHTEHPLRNRGCGDDGKARLFPPAISAMSIISALTGMEFVIQRCIYTSSSMLKSLSHDWCSPLDFDIVLATPTTSAILVILCSTRFRSRLQLSMRLAVRGTHKHSHHVYHLRRWHEI